MTTVGYGDAIPATAEGKVIGGFVQVLGVLILALPAAILAGGFTQELARRRNSGQGQVCPHCGQELRGDQA